MPGSTPPANGSAIEDAFVTRVKEAVEKNMENAEFTIEQLYKLVFMSQSQLQRKLDALTGCSPNKFIRMIRLNKANSLLLLPDTSIGTVAVECGFNDAGYFARVFKQETGTAPNEWRMQQALVNE